jgi:hypothetical protein
VTRRCVGGAGARALVACVFPCCLSKTCCLQ